MIRNKKEKQIVLVLLTDEELRIFFPRSYLRSHCVRLCTPEEDTQAVPLASSAHAFLLFMLQSALRPLTAVSEHVIRQESTYWYHYQTYIRNIRNYISNVGIQKFVGQSP